MQMMNLKKTIRNQVDHINETPQVGARIELIVEIKQSLVKKYYELIKEKYNLEPDYIDYTNL